LRIIRKELIAFADNRARKFAMALRRSEAHYSVTETPNQRSRYMGLKGSKTEENLKAAFAGESQANRRYLYFAQKADVEGYNDVAAVFRSTAEGETGHAHGHLEYLEECGDPATGEPIGDTSPT
jgi:rubrerythrin